MTKIVGTIISLVMVLLGGYLYYSQVEEIRLKKLSVLSMERIIAVALEKREEKDFLSSQYFVRIEYPQGDFKIQGNAEVDSDFFEAVDPGKEYEFVTDGFNIRTIESQIREESSQSIWNKWTAVGGYFLFAVGFLSIFVSWSMKD